MHGRQKMKMTQVLAVNQYVFTSVMSIVEARTLPSKPITFIGEEAGLKGEPTGFVLILNCTLSLVKTPNYIIYLVNIHCKCEFVIN